MRNIFIFLLTCTVLPACANNSDTIAQQEKMAAALKFNCHRVLPSGTRLMPDNFCQCFSDKAKQTLASEDLREVFSLFQTSADWRDLERGYAQLGDTVTYKIIEFAEACDGRDTQ